MSLDEQAQAKAIEYVQALHIDDILQRLAIIGIFKVAYHLGHSDGWIDGLQTAKDIAKVAEKKE